MRPPQPSRQSRTRVAETRNEPVDYSTGSFGWFARYVRAYACVYAWIVASAKVLAGKALLDPLPAAMDALLSVGQANGRGKD